MLEELTLFLQLSIELQVGNLRRTVQDLERGSELSALRADLVKLHDKLNTVRATMKAPPSNGLSELRTKVNSLERALKKQDSLETKLLKIEEAVKEMERGEEIAAL